LQPYPALNAVRFSGQQLLGSQFEAHITDYPGVKGYRFTRGDQRWWILWSLDGENHTVDLPTPPSAVYDVYGAVQEANQQVEVTLAPLYIEWVE
jgi:hypothetical protein